MSPRAAAAGALAALLLASAAAAADRDARPRGQAAPAAPAMTAANRTSGVAPLAVFFDAVDTRPEGPAAPFAWTSGVVQPQDLEGTEYAWDFGDAGAGTWPTTGLPRNEATGYTAAHVYERPGKYTAQLKVTDAAGAVHVYAQTITVGAFAGQTYYVAANGDDRAPGTSPSRPFATFDRGFAAVNGGPNRRLLLRRGDRFRTPGVIVTTPGPGIIGAYGEGPRPVLEVSGTEGGIRITAADWRIMDVELVGPGRNVDQGAAIGYADVKQTVNALALRVRATEFRTGLGNGDWKPIYATPHDGNAWVECEVTADHVGGMYVGGRRLAVLGNDLHDMSTTHVLRVWQAHKAVIAHNRLWNPGSSRHALKLHGPERDDGRPETRWVTISDNLARGKVWALAIGPQNGESNEPVSHVVVERNRTFGEGSVQADVFVWARDVVVRNNVFDATGSSRSYAAVGVARRGVEAPPERVRVVNNTVVRRDAADEVAVVQVDATPVGLAIRNNLVSAPLARHVSLVSGTPRTAPAQDHNLLTRSPGFRDPERGDFALQPGSPAVDAGAPLTEVRGDLRRNGRPRGAGWDLGAVESQ